MAQNTDNGILRWINSTFDDIRPQEMVLDSYAGCIIEYSDDYAILMSFFKAISDRREYSNRALKLTEHMISCNPANYTAWCYRRLCIQSLDKTISEELAYNTEKAIETPKNYQIWYHRRVLLEYSKVYNDELSFMKDFFDQDEKNYHAWANRQWLLKVSNNFVNEITFVQELLEKDVRNNSAWNHRFFVVFKDWNSFDNDEKQLIVESEAIYAFEKLEKVSLNKAIYSYIQGICLLFGDGSFKSSEIIVFKVKSKLAEINNRHLFCSPLLFLLYQICKEKQNITGALECLEQLIDKDFLRKKYWIKLSEQLKLPSN